MSSLLHVILKNSKFILFVSIFFCQISVRADLTGSLRSSYWNRDKSFADEEGYFVGSAWITFRPNDVLGTQLYFEAYVQGQNLSRDSMSYGDVREAYVEKSVGAMDIKLGRQIIIWGRADKINPTDSFSTKDLTFLTSDDEEQRLGHFAAQIKYNFDQVKLIGIWQPEWRTPVFPLAPQAGIRFKSSRPDRSQNQFGVKIDSSGGETDWSLSYFRGFSRTPNLRILSSTPVLFLGLDYGPIQVYGADFAKNIGQYGFRGEIAYTETQDKSGNDPLEPNSNWQAVLGADKTIIENLNINIQIIYKNVSEFSDPEDISDLSTRLLSQNLAIISNQKYKEQVGLSFRPVYKMLNETLELELAFLAWQKNGDSLIRPKITYALTDQFKAIIGGEFYDGPSETLFGQLKDVSSGFAEVRYLF